MSAAGSQTSRSWMFSCVTEISEDSPRLAASNQERTWNWNSRGCTDKVGEVAKSEGTHRAELRGTGRTGGRTEVAQSTAGHE